MLLIARGFFFFLPRPSPIRPHYHRQRAFDMLPRLLTCATACVTGRASTLRSIRLEGSTIRATDVELRHVRHLDLSKTGHAANDGPCSGKSTATSHLLHPGTCSLARVSFGTHGSKQDRYEAL